MCKKLFVLTSFLLVLSLAFANVASAAVIEVRVAAGEDDTEEDVATGAIDMGSSDLEITEEGEPALNQLVGMRFNGIAIPQGAVITSAYVQFQVDETDVPGDNRPGTKFLKGEASDNAAALTTADFDISSRPTTTAEASWDWPEWLTVDEEGPDQQTSDISAVIREIVDRPGWASGNSLVLIITGSGENTAESFDGEAEAAPLLHIEYIPSPPPVDPGTDGLVAFYALDGDPNDSSGNELHGTIAGDPNFVEGPNGMALELDGVDDYVDLGNPAMLDFGTGDFTISAWINLTTIERATVYAKGGDNGGGIRYTLAMGESNDNKMTLTTDDDVSKVQARGDTVVNDGVWHHVVGMRSGDTSLVYVDGNKDGTLDLPEGYDLSGTTQHNALLGAITSHTDGSLEKFFTGLLDEVAIYGRALSAGEIRYLAGFRLPADVTAPGDVVQGVPNDGDWPGAETPDLAFDDDSSTKFLHFKGDFDPDPNTGGSGLQITPAAGTTIVTGLTLTTANDVPGRDPIAFELSGSNDSIDGPYELIASGDIVDFAQEAEWPRFTMNKTPILFHNDNAYAHYQLIFTAIRGPVGGSVNSMQIAEVELIGTKIVVYDFETDTQGWGDLKDGTAVTVTSETSGSGSQSLVATVDEAAHAQEQGGMASSRDFTVDDALGGINTLSFLYRADDPNMDGGNFVFHWIMSSEAWSGGGWYGNGLYGVLIADGQWHQQTVDLSILGADAGGWEGAWGDETAWDFRDDLLYSFEILFEPTDATTTGSKIYIDDVVFSWSGK